MIGWGEVDCCTSMTLMEPACQSVKYRRPDTSLYANRTAPLPAQTEQQRPSEKEQHSLSLSRTEKEIALGISAPMISTVEFKMYFYLINSNLHTKRSYWFI